MPPRSRRVGRGLRRAVVVQHALRGRVGQAADSGREDRTEFDALVAEAVAPAHRVAGRELAHLAEVGFGDREVARRRIDLDVAVQVALKLVIDVNIGSSNRPDAG